MICNQYNAFIFHASRSLFSILFRSLFSILFREYEVVYGPSTFKWCEATCKVRVLKVVTQSRYLLRYSRFCALCVPRTLYECSAAAVLLCTAVNEGQALIKFNFSSSLHAGWNKQKAACEERQGWDGGWLCSTLIVMVAAWLFQLKREHICENLLTYPKCMADIVQRLEWANSGPGKNEGEVFNLNE